MLCVAAVCTVRATGASHIGRRFPCRLARASSRPGDLEEAASVKVSKIVIAGAAALAACGVLGMAPSRRAGRFTLGSDLDQAGPGGPPVRPVRSGDGL